MAEWMQGAGALWQQVQAAAAPFIDWATTYAPSMQDSAALLALAVAVMWLRFEFALRSLRRRGHTPAQVRELQARVEALEQDVQMLGGLVGAGGSAAERSPWRAR